MILDSPDGSRDSTPDGSRDSTPDGSGRSSVTPSSLSRHYNSAYAAICGDWPGASSALTGNVGRLLTRIRCFSDAAADLRQPQAAVQKQLQLMRWVHETFLPLVHGFADSSLILRDDDLRAVRDVAQRLVNAQAALLALDPPAAPRCYGEQAVQVLTFVFHSEYLRREGVRIPTTGPEAQFMVRSTGMGLLLVLLHASCSHLIHLACTCQHAGVMCFDTATGGTSRSC